MHKTNQEKFNNDSNILNTAINLYFDLILHQFIHLNAKIFHIYHSFFLRAEVLRLSAATLPSSWTVFSPTVWTSWRS